MVYKMENNYRGKWQKYNNHIIISYDMQYYHHVLYLKVQ